MRPAGEEESGGYPVNKAFEAMVRLKYGSRYGLERDLEGYYAREIVRRMFEVWCHCKGIAA